jgi:hypothetical protein
VKEQATAKQSLWILEKCKNMRDGWRRDLINYDFAYGTVLCSFLFCRSLFYITPPPPTMLLHFLTTVHPAPYLPWDPTNTHPRPTAASILDPSMYTKIKLFFVRHNEHQTYNYELFFHIIPGWYTPQEVTRRHHSSGMFLCSTNPHISTAKKLRQLYFPENTREME